MVSKFLVWDEGAIKPLIVPKIRVQHITGEDEDGKFVAYRLTNQKPSDMFGWYIYLSPEDVHLTRTFAWAGRLDKRSGYIEVRRREIVDGKSYSVSLTTAVWERMHPGGAEQNKIWRLGHQLDFRRQKLSGQNPGSLKQPLRGVYWNPNHSHWRVRIIVDGEPVYVGSTKKSENDGYRMYNRYLRDLKDTRPDDHVIQAMPYNQVNPRF